MTRYVKQTPTASEGEYIWEVTVTSDQCIPNTHHSTMVMRALLQACLSTPGLLDCGNNAPQSLSLRHSGECWVLVMVATGP